MYIRNLTLDQAATIHTVSLWYTLYLDMVFTRFLEYNISGTASAALVQDILKKDAISNTKDSTDSMSLIIGTHVGDQNTMQIATQNYPPTSVQHLTKHLGTPSLNFTIEFNASTFGSNGALTQSVTEVVFNWFPVSEATPEFRKKIEDDFDHFNRLAGFPDNDSENGENVAYGWLDQEQERDEDKGEKMKVFMIVRGWGSMAAFGRFMESDKASKHLPILMAWGVPFKMVSSSSSDK